MIEITLPFPPSVNSLFGGGSKQKRFPSKRYKEWISSCPELLPILQDEECHVHYKFFWPDNRVRDGGNFLKSCMDYLVNEDVLMDDNWTVVASESWDHGGVDKKYPRVELTITVKGK